ncbi:MAG: hypothetical protein WA988_20485 [Candidatus Nanopelagicales bacterium]
MSAQSLGDPIDLTQRRSNDEFAMSDLATAVAEALEAKPALMDALAGMIATKLAATVTPPPLVGAEDAADSEWERPTQRSVELASWVLTEHPDIIAGSPDSWSAAMISASGHTEPRRVFEWAYSDDCETGHWRSMDGALVAPKPTRAGAAKAGPYTQMLLEYKTTQKPSGSRIVAGIDTVITGTGAMVQHYGRAKSAEPTTTWRRNAIAVIEVCGGDAGRVLDALRWAMRNKPFWRSNISGVPTERAFRRLYSDYREAGAGFDISRDGGDRTADTKTLVDGWVIYLQRIIGQETQVVATPVSYARAFALITGGGETMPAVPFDEAKALVKWILDPAAGRVQFYVDGTEFPTPAKAYKALLAMRSGDKNVTSRAGMGAGIATTNTAAADGQRQAGPTTITVKEV